MALGGYIGGNVYLTTAHKPSLGGYIGEKCLPYNWPQTTILTTDSLLGASCKLLLCTRSVGSLHTLGNYLPPYRRTPFREVHTEAETLL